MQSHHFDLDNQKNIYRQSETVQSFKHQFEKRMRKFNNQVKEDAAKKDYVTTWRDLLTGAAISSIGLAATTTVATIGAVGMLAAGPTGGISAVVGVGAVTIGAGAVIYQGRKRKKAAKEANDLLNEENDFDEFLKKVTKNLLRIYQFQLESCSPQDGERIADACYYGIKHQLLTNGNLNINDFLKAGRLQALIVSSATEIKKRSVSINGKYNEKANSRGAVTHAGLYCHQTGQFYQAKSSKPGKYGVIVFWDVKELSDYKSQVQLINRKVWQYNKMPPARVRALIQDELVYVHPNSERYIVRKSDSDLNILKTRGVPKPRGSVQLFVPAPGDDSKSTQRNNEHSNDPSSDVSSSKNKSHNGKNSNHDSKNHAHSRKSSVHDSKSHAHSQKSSIVDSKKTAHSRNVSTQDSNNRIDKRKARVDHSRTKTHDLMSKSPEPKKAFIDDSSNKEKLSDSESSSMQIVHKLSHTNSSSQIESKLCDTSGGSPSLNQSSDTSSGSPVENKLSHSSGSQIDDKLSNASSGSQPEDKSSHASSEPASDDSSVNTSSESPKERIRMKY